VSFDLEDNWSDASDYRGYLVVWEEMQWTQQDHCIYKTEFESCCWKIRLNNFPDEPLYTLLVNGKEVIHFNEWPIEWEKTVSEQSHRQSGTD
jgi:hypothetical protein